MVGVSTAVVLEKNSNLPHSNLFFHHVCQSFCMCATALFMVCVRVCICACVHVYLRRYIPLLELHQSYTVQCIYIHWTVPMYVHLMQIRIKNKANVAWMLIFVPWFFLMVPEGINKVAIQQFNLNIGRRERKYHYQQCCTPSAALSRWPFPFSRNYTCHKPA